MMAAGVTACTLTHEGFTLWFLGGGLLYGGCRLAFWLRGEIGLAGTTSGRLNAATHVAND